MGVIQSTATAADELVAGLLRGEAYGCSDERVEHIETHISHVFLIGERAYKIKKALDLGFLDFSTLEKRRRSCEEELRINCRLAPDLYLAVVPITGPRTSPRVEGEGEPIEYAVKMQRFDQTALLENVLAHGSLNGKLIEALAVQVARFHASVARALAGSRFGSPASIIGPAQQNFVQLAPLLRNADDQAMLASIREWTEHQHPQLRPLFEIRQREGFVRECHGDLHLGNLVLIGGIIRIFDAIEFSEALRWIDVMNEIAFLFMDLRVRERADLALRFLNTYLEASGDYAGVRLLPYYVIYRALVRAKVAAMRASQPDLVGEPAHAYWTKCRTHLRFAHEATLWRAPLLVISHGLSGAGKTACSQILVEVLEAIRVRSDVERKRLCGLNATARTGAAVGAGLYHEDVSMRTYARLLDLAEQMLCAGQSVLIDAAFLLEAQRAQFRALARRLGVPFAIASFTAPDHVLRERIAARARAGKDASEANIEVLEHQLRTHEPLTAIEQPYSVVFDTGGASAAQIRTTADRLRELARVPADS
ncbi:MAG TPA: AAA family ATPase [Burkholderiales bacterium]|nr:AAA family ATPase [Burkholderiales bacterium]